MQPEHHKCHLIYVHEVVHNNKSWENVHLLKEMCLLNL
jgi:hypothetical protein